MNINSFKIPFNESKIIKYDSKFFSTVAFITSIAIKEPMAPTKGKQSQTLCMTNLRSRDLQINTHSRNSYISQIKAAQLSFPSNRRSRNKNFVMFYAISIYIFLVSKLSEQSRIISESLEDV